MAASGKTVRGEPVAIIGSSCQFPGRASSIPRLWDLLRDPQDILREVPPERFPARGFFNQVADHHGTSNVSKSYFLEEDPCVFDNSFFNVNNREAEIIDPQQRLLLEKVYEAIESAGYSMDRLKGSDTGVFVGLMCADYFDIQMRDPESLPQYLCTGTARSIMSNRISYFFDWKGPSMTIDTACSSSLVAVHLAVQALRNQECHFALAAGVNLIFGPEMYIAESNLHMLSPTGRSRMWSADADGYARGEGCGSLVLKLLKDAIRDGDHIESIIRETGINSDGRTPGITMPSAASQESLIRQTYQKAGLDLSKASDRCQYFEAHGTGTLAGDPVEAEAICKAFFPDSQFFERDMSLYVGSIKTVIGHLEGAAGIAGVLKASLAVQNGVIVPNLHFRALNQAIGPFYYNLVVPTESVEWPTLPPGVPRRASVNSFGFGGTNAHLILDSYEPVRTRPVLRFGDFTTLDLAFPLLLSANSESSLIRITEQYVRYLRKNPETDMRDLAYTLSRRSVHPFRVAFAATSRENVVQHAEEKLNLATKVPPVPLGTRSHFMPSAPNRLLGIFTGQGSQWATMGRDLFRTSPLFAERLRCLDKALQGLQDRPNWSLTSELLASEQQCRLNEAALSQPCCTAIQIALVDLLRSAGISFNTVIGHSSGEIAAAYCCGALSARDAIIVAYYRGLCAQLSVGKNECKGAMIAAGLSFEKAVSLCSSAQFVGRLYVAAHNAPQSTTLSGDEDAVQEAMFDLKQGGTFARMLKVDTAYHSPHMQPCARAYLDSLRRCKIEYTTVRQSCSWISSVHGFEMDSSSDPVSDQYWLDNLVNPVLFCEAVCQAHADHGPFTSILEVGPHPALKGPTTQTLQHFAQVAVPYHGTLSRGTDDVSSFLESLGLLWTNSPSLSIDFFSFAEAMGNGISEPPKVLKGLPSYAWDHTQSFWRESRLSKKYRSRHESPHELLGVRIDGSNSEFRWRNIIRLKEVVWLRGHEFQGGALFPAAGYCAMALEASRAIWEGKSVEILELRDVQIIKAIDLEEDSPGIEILFSIHSIKQEGNDQCGRVVASFDCSACHVDGSGPLSTVFTGEISISFGPQMLDILPPRSEGRAILRPVDLDRFYECFSDVGLRYTGLFKQILTAERRMNEASTSASRPTSPYLIHPALLDMCFQSIFVGYFAPGDESFNIPFLPRSIKRLRFNPTPRTTNNIAKIDAFVIRYELPTEEHPPSITGDVDMFDDRNHKELQVEGLTCAALPRPEACEDRKLFFQTVWEEDVSSGLSARDAIKPDTEEEVELIELCERLAYYHFRNLQAQVVTIEVQATHKPLLNYLREFLPEIEVGKHPTFKKEWLHTTLDQLSILADRYCNSIDFAIMNAVGANLPSVLRGKTTMLEHMLEDNMLPRFYREGIGFRKINIALAQTVKQIAHRYPRMSILEIGAGTGGTTKEVLQILEGAFATYNYTDVSAGFFPAAREEFKSWESHMQFQVLDIEDEACSANFGNPNFDLIIASNVLHATKNLRETAKNVRSLLKPGGFILLTELTGDSLRPSLIFGGLPGWWSGVDDGRRFKPGISTKEWDSLLRETGFTGIQSCIHDFQDPARQTFSLLVSQATDSFIDLMRQTTLHTENDGSNNGLLIIGGNTERGLLVRRKVESFLSVWKGPMSILDSLEQIDATLMETVTTVLNITELDMPLFEKLSPTTFAGLQMLFHHARNIFWVTENCSEDNPYSNITVGLGRTVASESPHLRLQFLDIDCVNGLTPARITESFVRFLHAESAEKSSVTRLWTTEPELKYVQDRLLIPRILPVRHMNDRLNAHYRPIIQSLPMSKQKPQDTHWRNESYDKGFIRVRVSRSSLYALKVAPNIYLYLCLGHLAEEKSKTLLAFSSSRDSIIHIPQSWAIQIELTAEVEERAIAVISSLQIVREISIAERPGNLLLCTDDILFSRIISKKLSEMHWRVTLMTTKRPNDCDNQSTIFIHKNAPIRNIVAILPSDLSVTLDLTKRTAGGPSIFDAIPFFQDQYSGPDFFSAEPIHPPKYSRATITDVLQDLFGRFLGIPMDWTSSLGLPSISNTTLRSSTDLNLSFLTSVNWDINYLPLPHRIIPIDPVSLFCGDRTYLMIGLTGDIGQSLCLWMVRHGVRHIIVSSRNPSIGDPWQQEIERIGAKILVKAMDVTDRSALTKLEKHIRDEWPPLAGIANAAMVLADMPFNDMSYENFNRVLQPKVNGTAYLEQIFKYHELDFFVMFSSLASIIGNAGQSNYAAANMFMAALAAQRRRRGAAASVIDIGMIIGAGYVFRNEGTENILRRQGFGAISESDFLRMFCEAIVAGRPDSGSPSEIITGLQSSAGQESPPWSDNPRFSHHETGRENITLRHADDISMPLKERLATAQNDAEFDQIVRNAFWTKLQVVLQLEPENINGERPLVELGIDSLMAVEIRSWWLKQLDFNFPVIKILGGVSAFQLCNEFSSVSFGSSKSVSVSTESDQLSSTTSAVYTEEKFSDSTFTRPDSTTIGSMNRPVTESSVMTRPTICQDIVRLDSLSFAESSLWFLMGCLDSPIFHNCTVYYTINGPVGFSRLKYAFIQAATRHESLRTTYSFDPSSGETKRGILKAPRLIWSQRDDANETEAVAEFSRMKKHVFDLENGHTMAVTLLSCGQNEHVLLLGHHHLIMDGTSLTNLLREVAHIYGSGTSLSPTVSQYANFSDRQRKYVLSEGANKDREYYKREFADITAPLPLLPVAKSAFRHICTDYEICTVQRRLNASLHSRIRQASSSVMSTPFQFHLSVLPLLLHRTLNVEDICIAIGNANRVDEEFDGTIGLILDVVPIRFYPNSSQTFNQLVHKTRQKVIAALSHGRTPYHTVLSGPDEAKKSTLSPLFQVVMNYISGATNTVRFGDAFLEYRDSEEAKHAQDLVVTIREDPDGTTLVTIAGHEYLYGNQEIEAILDIYFNLIQEVSEDGAMYLPLYNLFPESAKRHSLILGQGEAAPASWPETLSKRVSELSRGSPEQLALKDQKGSTLSYREMQNRILTIADILWHSGAREGHFIAVLCGPTTDTVCSILAIWRIGAVYVPLDPSHGTGRLNSITSDCQPEILICSDNSHLVVAKALGVAQTLDLTLPSRITNCQIPDRSRGSATAALIYTSGSTGAPKGVLLSHNNLVAQISAVQKRLNVGREVVLQQSSMGFDASLYQIFMALANGGTLVMAASRSEGRELTRVILEEKITMTVAVPTEYQYWITSGLKNLRRCTDWYIAISAGERLTPALMAAFRSMGLPNLCLFNAYGPTEGSISCAMGKISLHEGSQTESTVDVIGTTLPGYQLYILDENLQPLQIGWPGEIFVGGAGVSLGYLNRESETRLNFIVNPLVSGKDSLEHRLYRTGDRGKILPDGRLRFMGRISCDTQVKLRGVRIELEEIAAVIVRASAGAITEAVVIQKDDSDPYLVAFVVFSHRRPVEMDPNYLHKLIRSLPLASFMLPAMAVSIDSIPININGKRDTAKLKAIPLHQPGQLTEDTDLSFIEKKIAELWREVLPSVSSAFSISRGTDFFSLGGNSILLLRIQTKIREMSGVQVSLPKLFQCSTLGEMAILIGVEASTSLDDQIIDWHLETSLSGSSLSLHENPDSPKWPPKVILMTGSTGFLGRAILSLLVDNPQIHAVHCLAVRTPSRLAHSPKLVIHSGDLSHTEFGLDGTTLAALSLTVDAIIHNGANVSFLKPYKALRASNVLATKLLAKLAAPRKIPIHYVSSAGVTRLAQQLAFPEASVSSYTPPSNVLTDGYLASKWASEVLLENAHTAWNIPITIHRPSSIIGPGAPERDLFANIIAISKQLRAAPILDHWTGVFDLISVDRVSREIVSSVVDEKKGENCTGLSFRNWCGERRFEASGLKGYIERELQADHTGRIIEIRQIAFVEWINDAKEEGLDPLVVAYLERMSELDGGHLLPILDSRLVS